MKKRMSLLVTMLVATLILAFSATAVAASGNYYINSVSFSSTYGIFYDTAYNDYDTVQVPSGQVKVTVDADDDCVIYINGKRCDDGSRTITVSGNDTVRIEAKYYDMWREDSETWRVYIDNSEWDTADLSSLSVKANSSSGANILDQSFKSSRTGYTASASSSVSKAYFACTAESTTSQVALYKNGRLVKDFGIYYGSTTVSLDSGTDTYMVRVKTRNGDTKDYEIDITKDKSSSDATLKSLSGVYFDSNYNSKNLAISPSFKASTTSYNANVDASVSRIGLNFAATDQNSTIKIYLNNTLKDTTTGNDYVEYNLPQGTNKIKFVVTAPNTSTSKTYYLDVTRSSVSSTATLDSLTLYDGISLSSKKITLSPTFKSTVNDYSAKVTESLKKMLVSFEPTESKATVKVYQNNTLKGTFTGNSSIELSLNEGQNTLKFSVTAPNSATTKNYFVTVVKGSDDATLSNLTMRDNNDKELYFSPYFESTRLSYASSLANEITSITIKAVSSDPDATIKIDGSTVDSGSWSKRISLAVGENEIPIVVTSPNGTKKTYTINVTRSGTVIPTVNKTLQVTLNNTTAYVNGRAVKLDAAPFLYKYAGISYTMVPIRFIGEQGLNALVSWNAYTNTVSITKNGTNIVMTLGQTDPFKGLNCPPVSRNNRTFVPLRYVAQTLGCTVNYTSVNTPIVIICPQ